MTLPEASLDPFRFLPDDEFAGTLVARCWSPDAIGGPCVVALRKGGVFDLSASFSTMSGLLDLHRPADAVRACAGRQIASFDDLVANSASKTRKMSRPFLLAPCDLQVIKAAGVTFATSLIERVIEEHSGGDPALAQQARAEVLATLGQDIGSLVPGSPQAQNLKRLLQARRMWSQYLEVGIGPEAELFTKAPVLAAVGSGDAVGVRSDSAWNNPEPEVVLAVSSRGEVVGATLGNDVNLRDIEGRSALLLGKAKDNNASCAIGPFIRLFDDSFSLDDLRREKIHLTVYGAGGYKLHGTSSMAHISRDPLDLVAQALATHQYPDGLMLFLGTLFAPTEDRHQPGGGFTHEPGDVVSIRSAFLGELRNEVTHCELAPPWRFGLRAFMANLAARGLIVGDA